MAEPFFLDVDAVTHIHRREIENAGGDSGLRDREGLDAAVAAPQATHDGEFLMDLFDMAAAYAVAIIYRHPFIDGNKRAGAAAALTFLYLNGYEVNERHPEELADVILEMLGEGSKVDREQLGAWFRERAVPRAASPNV